MVALTRDVRTIITADVDAPARARLRTAGPAVVGA
jgi:hypothetical protein